MKRLIVLGSLSAAVMTASVGPLHAQLRDEHLTRQLLQGLPSELLAPTASLSPGQAARRAKDAHGGEVLSVEPETQGYRVRLLIDGEVRFVTISD